MKLEDQQVRQDEVVRIHNHLFRPNQVFVVRDSHSGNGLDVRGFHVFDIFVSFRSAPHRLCEMVGMFVCSCTRFRVEPIFVYC